MKKTLLNFAFTRALIAALVIISFAPLAKANPYASGLTNNAGTISFVLNEAASDVAIIYSGNVATNDLGALAKGVHTFSLTFNSVAYTNYSIAVFNQGVGTFKLLSTNSNPECVFYEGRGVAVNCNPKTANFGRIYVVASGAASVVYPTTGGGHTRAVTKGVYMINADLSDALGLGATARLGGMVFSGQTSIGPNRLSIGPDDTVYVGDDDGAYQGGTPAFGVWACAPDISSSTALFATAGAAYNGGNVYGGFDATPRVTGSLATGDLTLYGIEYDLAGGGTTGDNLWKYNINATTPDTTPPTLVNSTWNNIGITGVHVDLAITTNGYNHALTYYCAQDRSSGTGPGNNSLTVLDSNGVHLWDSESAWAAFNGSADQFNFAWGVAVSPDNTLLALSIGSAGQVWVVPLTNGIPDLSGAKVHTGFVGAAANSWGVAFDAANNIYLINYTATTTALSQLVEYSLEQVTLATTSNDSTVTNGTFNFVYPDAVISAATTAGPASQNHGTPIPGTFTISRTDTAIPPAITSAQPLTVFFTLGGTATNAVYTATAGASTFTSTNGAGALITNSITLAPGQLSTNITVTPVADNVSRLTTTVILSILPNTNYQQGASTTPILNIINTGPQAIQIGSVVAPSAYKGLTNDFASFTISRLGDTNFATSYTITNFTYAGTAVVGTDFTSPARTIASAPAGNYPLQLGGGVVINPGDVTVTATISPLQTTTNYTGNKTAVIGLAADASVPYTVIGSGTATLTIIDNAYPSAPVLFADPLTNTVDVTTNDGVASWRILFVSTNTTTFPYDPNYVQFGYLLANDSIGNPPNGATTALKVTVNKDGTTGSAASSSAINIYPKNVSFSNNYALRFNMLVVEGSSGLQATEGPLFGVDYSGISTNWYLGDYGGAVTAPGGGPFGNAPWFIDGITYGVNADASGVSWGDYVSITGGGTNAQFGYIPIAFNGAGSGPAGANNTGGIFAGTFANAFKSSYNTPPGPYTSYPENVANPSGLPVNSLAVSAPKAWADVEVKQINNKITMSINKTTIFTYVNTNLFTNASFPGGTYYISTNGTVMLGYVDPFAGVGGSDGAAYFSNIRVVQLGLITINQIQITGGNVVLTFTTEDGDDTTSSFTVLSSGTAANLKTDRTASVDTVVTATFTQNAATGVFTATFPQPATSAVFYRIKHN